jgi:NAD(P)H-dependent flavin oxidoreductase YrpB (nitropropane dioxygenase family)
MALAVKELNIPFIASGGIAGFAAALALGAAVSWLIYKPDMG